MFMVDAPVRMSTPGQATSGADGVGDAGCVTPGFAPEKKLETRLLNDGESSLDPMLETDEQPDIASALANTTNMRRTPRLRPSICPGRIEIARLFRQISLPPKPYNSQTVAPPRPIEAGRERVDALGQGDGSSLSLANNK
jgi:hypothetical protein